jgi:hypothetical protein
MGGVGIAFRFPESGKRNNNLKFLKLGNTKIPA